MLLALMTLTAYRLTRVIAVDKFPPMLSMRVRVYLRYGENSWQFYLINCVWCVGVYASAIVVAPTAWLANIPLPVLWWGAVASLVGIIHTLVKAGDTWNAKNAAGQE